MVELERMNAGRFNLSRQIFCFIAVYLLVEILFVVSLGIMLAQVEHEAERQEFAGKVMSKTNSLLINLYDTGDAIGEFSLHQDGGSADRSDSSKESADASLLWLKENLEGEGVAPELLERIEKNAAICMPVLTSVKKMSASLSRSESLSYFRKRKAGIQRNIDTLIADLMRLVDYARKVQRESPLKEQAERELLGKVLLAGLCANLLLSIMAAFFFSSRVAGRVNSLVADVEAFKHGELLGEPRRGDDEIALVDRVFHDVAARLAEEEELLRQNESRLRAIIDSLPLGFIILSEGGTIEGFNDALERTFGYDSHELIGKRASMLFARGSGTDSATMLDRLLANSSGRGTIEINARRKDGSELPVEIALAELNMGMGVKRLAIVSDATAQVETRKMRHAFVSMVSRELKQPLTHVGAFLSGIIQGEFGQLSEKATKNAAKVEQNIDRMILLLNDLFDFEKLESGEMDVEPRVTNLESVLSQVRSATSLFAQKHGVEIDVPAVDGELYVDENRIIQVLINLISNAVKYSRKGTTVSVEVERSEKELTIKVIDKGRGIPASHLSSVFERFQQVETDDARKKGGTGLGLAVCKAIIVGHGGKIGVESQLGKGSTFWFSIPVAQAVA